MKYMLTGERNGLKFKEFFEITKENFAIFNDKPDPMNSTGVRRLKAKIRREYKAYNISGTDTTFEWTLSSLKPELY